MRHIFVGITLIRTKESVGMNSVKSDANFRSKSGGNKTEDFAEQNWLIRDDVQKAMIIYLQYMKRYNFMKRYQEMNKKALSGDVNSAKVC